MTTAVLWCALALPAAAGIRVVEDEVYFRLRAPGAKEVFLVGDFNNWNPTVEKMQRSGDVFEISLYMVEGSYRYKFVVDGNWITDPDNPGDPKRGSALVLVERPAGLMLLTEEPGEPAAEPYLLPVFRYIGQFRWNRPEDARLEDRHILDLDLAVNREKVRGRALLKSTSDVWDAPDQSFEVTMNRGYVGTDFSGIRLDAFDNDGVVWTSLDPVTLIGDLGVFDYNAGYDRKGVSADYGFSDGVHLRGFYADHTGPLRPRQSYPVGDLSGAAGGDTTVYAFDGGVGDSDVLGLEFYIDASDFQVGIVRRSGAGLRPGVMADVSLAPAGSTAVVCDTREDSDGTQYWLRLKKLFGAGAYFGYGRGHASIRHVTRETQPIVDTTDSLQTTQLAQTLEGRFQFETSNRYFAGLEYRRGNTAVTLEWDRATFEFAGPVYGGSDATVDRWKLQYRWTPPAAWEVDAWAEYTEQDYGDTPPELLVDSPVRNMWLDWRDNFTVANIVGIDTDAYTNLVVRAAWYPERSGEDADGDPPYWFPVAAPPFVRFEAGTTAHRFFDRLEYTRARLGAAWLFRGRYFAMADGRAAWYDKPGWGARETFLSGYVETGYVYRWMMVNLGWGFDPVVFDPVTNQYNDIGRLRVIRESVAGGVERGRSAEVGERVYSLERALENVQTIKLEVIVLF